MGSRCVVILAPLFDRALGVRQVDEPVRVETLVPEPTVETFYERVLRRLSRLDEPEFDAMFVRPGVEEATSEFRTVVDDDLCWVASYFSDRFERDDDR